MANHNLVKIAITCTEKNESKFFFFLNQGFRITIESGQSISDLFSRQLGLDPAYLEQRVQTIFLNGKAVDDVAASVVDTGSVLAFSAAMPGVLGATLRKGGFFAAMRSQISYQKKIMPSTSEGEGEIVLKLLNRVAVDLGPLFLQRGIVVTGSDWEGFFSRWSDLFLKENLQIKMDGEKRHLDDFGHREWAATDILLQVNPIIGT